MKKKLLVAEGSKAFVSHPDIARATYVKYFKVIFKSMYYLINNL